MKDSNLVQHHDNFRCLGTCLAGHALMLIWVLVLHSTFFKSWSSQCVDSSIMSAVGSSIRTHLGNWKDWLVKISRHDHERKGRVTRHVPSSWLMVFLRSMTSNNLKAWPEACDLIIPSKSWLWLLRHINHIDFKFNHLQDTCLCVCVLLESYKHSLPKQYHHPYVHMDKMHKL